MGEELYRRRTVYEHVRDMQAERDAALGAAVRKVTDLWGSHPYDIPTTVRKCQKWEGMAEWLLDAIADALEEEA